MRLSAKLVAALAVSLILPVQASRADFNGTGTLHVGNPYGETILLRGPNGAFSETAGNFGNSPNSSITNQSQTLPMVNPPGTPSLPFMYCVDLTHFINPYPATYSTQYQTFSGSVSTITTTNTIKDYGTNGTPSQGVTNLLTGNGPPSDFALGVSKVEFLIDTWGLKANVLGNLKPNSDPNTGVSVADQQAALQAAIWHVLYGGLNLNTGLGGYTAGSGVVKAYNEMIDSSGNVKGWTAGYTSSDVLFINPKDPTTGLYTVQEQVSLISNSNAPRTPLPGTLVMSSIVLGMVGVRGAIKRRKSHSSVS